MKSLLVAVALLFVSSQVEAGGFWNGGGYGGAYGLGGYAAPSMYAADTRVPYFALHPPVYYSYPVPRPYGFSPFAYPGWVPTPNVEAVEPQMMVNPHILRQPQPPATPNSSQGAAPTTAQPIALRKSATAASHDAVQPLRIVNPFVRDRLAADLK